MAPAPPVQLTGSYDHRIALGESSLLLRGDVRYRSSHDSSLITVQQAADGGSPYIRVPGRALADISATLALPHYISITGYVRNLTNERFLPDNWNVANVIPGNPPTVTTSQNSISDPRTFGVILNVKY